MLHVDPEAWGLALLVWGVESGLALGGGGFTRLQGKRIFLPSPNHPKFGSESPPWGQAGDGESTQISGHPIKPSSLSMTPEETDLRMTPGPRAPPCQLRL